MTDFKDRQNLEIFRWEEFFEPFTILQFVCLGPGELDSGLKNEMFTILSAAAGCRHCQAHGGYMLNKALDKPVERIQALWNFDRSDQFTEAEKAAYRFALAAGSCPNAVTADHHADLRAHYNDQQIREMMAVVGMSGFLNRYSESVAVVTDHGAANWAAENLTPVGWSIGKHAGTDEERRPELGL
jgi:alkylhydroperoxidase family enzyme